MITGFGWRKMGQWGLWWSDLVAVLLLVPNVGLGAMVLAVKIAIGLTLLRWETYRQIIDRWHFR